MIGPEKFEKKTRHLGRVGVVEHPEDHPGEWIDVVLGGVGRDGEGRQGVLEGLAEDAVEGQVGAQEALVGPVVLAEFGGLRPQTVQKLGRVGGGNFLDTIGQS